MNCPNSLCPHAHMRGQKMVKIKFQVRNMFSQFVFYGDSCALFFIFLMIYDSNRLSELISELFDVLGDSKTTMNLGSCRRMD